MTSWLLLQMTRNCKYILGGSDRTKQFSKSTNFTRESNRKGFKLLCYWSASRPGIAHQVNHAGLERHISTGGARSRLMFLFDCECAIQVDSLKETISSLQAELEVRAKDKQVAETAVKNAEALKRQADGVAQEYDRLLEENDNLRSLLGRVDSKYAQVEGKKSA
jgi:FtsZ-binding cell division protein ZapB